MVFQRVYLKECSHALLISKRSYNPPSMLMEQFLMHSIAARKTWSKQHPDFRTRRPLVEPYNLGRLHPEKEWWRLPRKGLSPQTFMGFPDVAHISKRGGSLYTHLMDGHTLTMVVYRCLETGVDDITIWRRLSLQALQLAMSLDPYIVSLLFLYFSRSPHYDYKFVATYTGRVLATLDQFKLLECANVLMAMENSMFMHEATRDRILKHAEILCLTGYNSIPAEDALKFISAINGAPTNTSYILMALGEIIEMADLSTEDGDVIVDALYHACTLKGQIDRLCVNRIFDEVCDRLERVKECKHSYNIAVLNAMATFHYRRPLAVDMIQDRLKGNVHSANLVELCRYMALSTRIYPALSVANVRSEAIKAFDQLVEDPLLGVQYLGGCLPSAKALDSKERMGDLPKDTVLDLYTALVNTKTAVLADFMPYVNRVVKHAWNLLPDLTVPETCRLAVTYPQYIYISYQCHGEHAIASLVGREMVEEAFRRIADSVDTLTVDEKCTFIRFCTKDTMLASQLSRILDGRPELIPPSRLLAEALLDLYET
ncbi:hypothetical protein X943_001403 [Babesia divergens]|uniref:Uncharacterized protein n=1 Tax=Babesia divergens TaxID=32595 RepID=A0AAD9LHX6_BABDI|nr:hypothetical protein X943_001403 [Babesia divergens]